MLKKVYDLDFEILDTYPKIKLENSILDPEKVVGNAGYITINEKDFIEKVRENPNYRVILKESIARGHASLSTTPHIFISIRGIRLFDYFFTAFPFGSYVVQSQRFVKSFSSYIPKKEFSEDICIKIEKCLENQYSTYDKLLKASVPREEARRVLSFLFNSNMVIDYPLESFVSIVKYCNALRDCIPTILYKFVNEMWNRVKKMEGIKNVAKAIFVSPHYNTRFPTFFHKFNFLDKITMKDDIEILDESLVEFGVLDEFIKKYSIENSWKEYRNKSIKLGIISNSIPFEYSIKMVVSVSLTCFNEMKRHRTIDMFPESIYSAVKNGEKRIYIPPSIRGSDRLIRLYVDSINESLYHFEVLKEEIGEKDAILVIPQALKIKVVLNLNLNQLISPFLFYRIRSCSKGEVEMLELCEKIVEKIKLCSKYKKYVSNLLSVICKNGETLPKCFIGICPEKEFCKKIFEVRDDYSPEFHEKVNEEKWKEF